MIYETALSFPISIFMAGDVRDAQKYCQLYCNDLGLCVTVTPTKYIYTDGSEEGFVVGLINYPRFPSTPHLLTERAFDLAHELMRQLGQESFSVQTPTLTHWFSRRTSDQEQVA